MLWLLTILTAGAVVAVVASGVARYSRRRLALRTVEIQDCQHYRRPGPEDQAW